LETGDGLWWDIVKVKYIRDYPTCLIPNKINDSPIWSDLLKVRHIYLTRRGIKINNWQRLSFWLDSWLEGVPLCQQYPVLYELAEKQKCSVAEVKRDGWVIHFKSRRGLLEVNGMNWPVN
jgi:hypothetical protein